MKNGVAWMRVNVFLRHLCVMEVQMTQMIAGMAQWNCTAGLIHFQNLFTMSFAKVDNQF